MKATLKIKDLTLQVHIGAYAEEKKNLQQVVCDVEIETDITEALVSDDLCDALDYMECVREVEEHFSTHSYNLIETAVDNIADIFLAHPRSNKVSVTFVKPDALANATFAGICIEKEKGVE